MALNTEIPLQSLGPRGSCPKGLPGWLAGWLVGWLISLQQVSGHGCRGQGPVDMREQDPLIDKGHGGFCGCVTSCTGHNYYYYTYYSLTHLDWIHIHLGINGPQ